MPGERDIKCYLQNLYSQQLVKSAIKIDGNKYCSKSMHRIVLNGEVFMYGVFI